MLTKDKIILVYYIDMGKLPPSKVGEYIQTLGEQVKNGIPEDDDSIIQYVLPVRGENSRVECINPKFVTEEEYEYASTALALAQDRFNAAIESFNKEKTDEIN